MNPAVAAAFVVATVAALADWHAVAGRHQRLEYVAKPATLAALAAAAATIDPAHGGQRAWFVVALLLSLAGDVFLMLPDDKFVAGLASFLAGHVAYIIGFAVAGVSTGRIIVGAVVVVPVTVVIGSRIVRALREHGDTALLAPVVLYMTAITAMTVLAFREPVATVGTALFFGSDALIAWTRFVNPIRWAPLAIMVTYHVGQALLVASLT